MQADSQNRRLERISCIESAFFSLMVGMGETYFAALVLALGMGEFTASSIAIVPVVLGSILQLQWPKAISYFRTEKNWVIFCATTQSLLLAWLGGLCLFGNPNLWFIFIATTIYWSAHFAAGPAWNTWITSILDKTRHFQFFVSRSRVHELAVLVGLIIVGISLQLNSSLFMFGMVFIAAAFFRAGSAVTFLWHPVKKTQLSVAMPSIRNTLLLCWEKRQVIYLLIFTFLFQFAVQIAGPFFTPFMLVELHFSYLEFALLISLPFIARALTYKYAAIIGSKFGIDKVWTLGVLLIAPLPFLWILFHQFWQLALVQILGGVAWSCAEYGQTIALIQRFQPERRSSVLTVANLFASIGMGIGFTVGGIIWHLSPENQSYNFVLGTSSTARFLVCLGIPFVIFRKAKIQRLFLRWIGVRPGLGGISRPILSDAFDSEAENHKKENES